jgi:8-oxo-dGTP diphosphatase
VADTTEPDFYAGLPRKRLGAGALITDAAGRILLVQTTYKETWEIPGGIVEATETAPAGCARELREELGVDIPIGRLLVIDHQIDAGSKGDSIMFIYEGGQLTDTEHLRLDGAEVKCIEFVRRDDLATRTTPKLARRMGHAVDARTEGIVVELENGVRRL